MAERVKILLSEEEVNKRISEIGEQISKDYAGKQVHLVCVLKGGAFFMCELAKRITVPVSMDFMSVSSYGGDTKSSGVVKIVKDLDESLKDKDVIVVEDIVEVRDESDREGLRIAIDLRKGANHEAILTYLFKSHITQR